MRVVSLFSGAGGLDLGFRMAGHELVWANDAYADAADTYRRNIGDHIVLGDIADIPSDAVPGCDIVIGGFPCQGFSVANTGRHEHDGRNLLYREMLRIIAARRPRFFLAENVKGILSLAGGRVFRMILDDFASLGYTTRHRVLNAADYGVPQTRLRVIIVGVRRDVPLRYEFPAPTHDREGTHGLRKWVSVTEALAGIPDPDLPNDVPNHDYSAYKLAFSPYLGHRPLHPDRPAPTVTARGDDRGGVVILPHPNARRRMSGRELAAVQSFPLDYRFSGSRSSVYRQIGNAVPPLLARAVAEAFNHMQEDAAHGASTGFHPVRSLLECRADAPAPGAPPSR